ncbi:Cystathionine beta-lyase/cystathionine gamma-synthase domain containing protein [Pandoravirus celtis]|uniref:Cystathionine beta-lyase/cystathionine gamma-synthase domain containing protein n=1 Tax=Pandoravirus celtis TaxID=2568002 RepID=A0A4D6EHJ4_9VIRU|nr:Cystathionine beta-lyase/cystathionine gamma-synthase domain containing protein [Pandoravirus celtis]
MDTTGLADKSTSAPTQIPHRGNDLLLHTPGLGAVVLASSWNQRSPAHPERTHYEYGRGAGPNQDTLASALRTVYPKAESIGLFCSGTAAVACVIDAALEGASGDVAVLVHKETYGGTDRLLDHLASTRAGFSYVVADLNNAEWVEQEIAAITSRQGSLRLIYAESCSNPSGFVVDIARLAAVRDRMCPLVPIAIDNSWLSILYDPMAHGADVVIESLTKHVGGGHLVAGMAAFAPTALGKNMHQRTMDHAEATGQHMAPFDAWLAETNINTLAYRVQTASRCCLEVAHFLQAHPRVGRVIYPGLDSHPDAAIARRVLGTEADGTLAGPTVLTFHVALDMEATTRMIDSSPIIHYASSYGKPVPLFDPHIAEGSADHYDAQPQDNDRGGSWIRLAMGHAVDARTVSAELDRLLHLHVPTPTTATET